MADSSSSLVFVSIQEEPVVWVLIKLFTTASSKLELR